MPENNTRKLRILLINPPYYRLFKNTYTYNKYPLSLAYLAGAICQETHWTPVVYNADFAVPSENARIRYLTGEGFTNFRANLQDMTNPIWAQVRETVLQFHPKVVGIYCCAPNSTSVSIIANIVKSFDRQITVIIGGPHPTSIRKNAMQNTNVDIIVKGEGERTITELLKKIEENGSLETVKGIIYRANDGVVETPEREPIRDLDSLSFPIQHAKEVLKDYEKYPLSAFNIVLATRGCPHNCFFCGSRMVFDRKTRFRSPENVTDEIKSLQKIGIKWFEFQDDSFGVNPTYLSQLCNSLIENCPGIRWHCDTRVDLINEEAVKLMKKAGCRKMNIGVESGNNETLHTIRKGITVEQALEAADIITKNGISLTSNFMFGFPTETVETLNDTYRCIKRIKGNIGYSIFTPYPGTEAFEYCREAGLISSTYDATLYNHQSPENCFCQNINKQRFREIATEIERYVDERKSEHEFRQVLSYSTLDRFLSSGAFLNINSLRDFIQNAITELKVMLRK
jgi:anaerobic magnesium-protoporphyrin IX monomethyl ester cyclase